MRSPRVVAVLLAISVLAPGVSAQIPSNAPPQIITGGTGEARVSPDRATVMIGVQSKAASAAAAGAENARRQRAVIDTMRALGATSDQISTMNYSVSPEMQYAPNQSPRVTGYTVSNTVTVDVRRIDDVAKFIDAALAKGANEIAGLTFFSSKADSARRAAMAIAVAKARADAEVLASAAGGSLGPLLELSSEVPAIRPMNQFMAAAAPAARIATPIEPGQQTVSVSITARWTFVPGR
jgi:uncharacterized protein YggE